MSTAWEHALIALGVLVVAFFVARLVDARMSRRDLAPEAATRYRVLRRTIFAAIVFVGVMSALLVIPQVRAVAGAILASSAVLGLVIGFASQRTIGNFVAGILIAFSQPLRLGDQVEVGGVKGVVEEIGLTYTWIRTRDNDRLVVPNEKLASDAIRNSTIRSPLTLVEVTVQVPASADLRHVVEALRGDGEEAYVTDLAEGKASIVVRTWVSGEAVAERAESDLRISLAARLQELDLSPGPTGAATETTAPAAGQ
jgi:small-conductance mechanosensitive channel